MCPHIKIHNFISMKWLILFRFHSLCSVNAFLNLFDFVWITNCDSHSKKYNKKSEHQHHYVAKKNELEYNNTFGSVKSKAKNKKHQIIIHCVGSNEISATRWSDRKGIQLQKNVTNHVEPNKWHFHLNIIDEGLCFLPPQYRQYAM